MTLPTSLDVTIGIGWIRCYECGHWYGFETHARSPRCPYCAEKDNCEAHEARRTAQASVRGLRAVVTRLQRERMRLLSSR